MLYWLLCWLFTILWTVRTILETNSVEPHGIVTWFLIVILSVKNMDFIYRVPKKCHTIYENKLYTPCNVWVLNWVIMGYNLSFIRLNRVWENTHNRLICYITLITLIYNYNLLPSKEWRRSVFALLHCIMRGSDH